MVSYFLPLAFVILASSGFYDGPGCFVVYIMKCMTDSCMKSCYYVHFLYTEAKLVYLFSMERFLNLSLTHLYTMQYT